MNQPTDTKENQQNSPAATIARTLLAGAALLLFTSFAVACEQTGEEGVFERRYALTEIPGFDYEDHLALLDHQDANIRYLAVANLLQADLLDKPDEDSEPNAEYEKLRAKLRALMDDPAAKVRAIAAYAPISLTSAAFT